MQEVELGRREQSQARIDRSIHRQLTEESVLLHLLLGLHLLLLQMLRIDEGRVKVSMQVVRVDELLHLRVLLHLQLLLLELHLLLLQLEVLRL